MTERDLFVACIPDIAGIIMIVSDFDDTEYTEWRTETLEGSRQVLKDTCFIEKVLQVIDSHRAKRREAEAV